MGDNPPPDLLCKACQEQPNDYAEQQRRIDDARYEALLTEYRRRPMRTVERPESGWYSKGRSTGGTGIVAVCVGVVAFSSTYTTARTQPTPRNS